MTDVIGTVVLLFLMVNLSVCAATILALRGATGPFGTADAPLRLLAATTDRDPKQVTRVRPRGVKHFS